MAVSEGLLEQLVNRSGKDLPLDSYVPIVDITALALVRRYILDILAREGGEDTIVVVNAVELNADMYFQHLADQTHRVFLLDETGTLDSQEGARPETIRCSDGLGMDHLLVVLSRRASFALIGSEVTAEGNTREVRGGWTTHRPTVSQLFQALFGPSIPPEALALLESTEHDASLAHSHSLEIMSNLMSFYDSKQVDMVNHESDLSSVLDILKSLSTKRCAHDIMYLYVEQIAKLIEVDRCSVLRVWGKDKVGQVLASHEDASVRDLEIDLGKYPEILRALDSGSRVLVTDSDRDPTVRPVREQLSAAGIRSLLVIPIVLHDENVGSLLLRASLRDRTFSAREVNFCEIVGEAASNALNRSQLLETIQEANKKLEHLAITDGLTGLHNYRHFRRRLQEEFDRATRYHLPMACLLIDIDDFKAINDTYGHLVGDKILKEVSTRVARTARRNDLIARYGGEELVAILPQTTVEGAEIHAMRISKSLSSMPYDGLPAERKVTASLGIGIFDRATMTVCDAIVQQADKALYGAKAAGKNCGMVQGRRIR